MARINLLPWRDWERERLKKEFFAVLGIMAGIGIGIVLLGYLYFGNAISNQEERNQYLEQKIADLQKQVKEIEELQKKKREMQEKIDVVQNLQAGRSVIVSVFDGLVRALPDGVYFTSVKLEGDRLSIAGTAEANARISSLMRELDQSELFKNPNLQGVKANPNFGETASDFTLTVTVILPGAGKDDSGTAAAGKGAAASKKKK